MTVKVMPALCCLEEQDKRKIKRQKKGSTSLFRKGGVGWDYKKSRKSLSWNGMSLKKKINSFLSGFLTSTQQPTMFAKF